MQVAAQPSSLRLFKGKLANEIKTMPKNLKWNQPTIENKFLKSDLQITLKDLRKKWKVGHAGG